MSRARAERARFFACTPSLASFLFCWLERVPVLPHQGCVTHDDCDGPRHQVPARAAPWSRACSPIARRAIYWTFGLRHRAMSAVCEERSQLDSLLLSRTRPAFDQGAGARLAFRRLGRRPVSAERFASMAQGPIHVCPPGRYVLHGDRSGPRRAPFLWWSTVCRRRHRGSAGAPRRAARRSSPSRLEMVSNQISGRWAASSITATSFG
jgi:hypothetical protein